ncbi:MAG: hypothetical protein CMJ89_17050 [Planctomycetes bacterium]|jgi:hypothetical protein|nr:hypothetical protein [Planctomycetota bacterium]
MSSIPHVLFRRALVCALALVSLGACASTSGSGGSGEPVRVTLRSYRGNQLFQLVAESHTNRVDYYSRPRANASLKVVSDKIADALRKELDRRGFQRNKKPGRAPSQGGSILTWSLEIAGPNGIDHWLVGAGTDAKQQQAFQESRRIFFELYNATFAYQAVENDKGKDFFYNGRPNPSGIRQ